MNKKEVLYSILSKLSVTELANALLVVQTLSKNNLLQQKYIDILNRIAQEMNIVSPDFVENVSVTTSDSIDPSVFVSVLSNDNKSTITTSQKESEDMYVTISSGSNCHYTRSLDQDIEKLLG